jgi:hypothetical protein
MAVASNIIIAAAAAIPHATGLTAVARLFTFFLSLFINTVVISILV